MCHNLQKPFTCSIFVLLGTVAYSCRREKDLHSSENYLHFESVCNFLSGREMGHFARRCLSVVLLRLTQELRETSSDGFDVVEVRDA